MTKASPLEYVKSTEKALTAINSAIKHVNTLAVSNAISALRCPSGMSRWKAREAGCCARCPMYTSDYGNTRPRYICIDHFPWCLDDQLIRRLEESLSEYEVRIDYEHGWKFLYSKPATTRFQYVFVVSPKVNRLQVLLSKIGLTDENKRKQLIASMLQELIELKIGLEENLVTAKRKIAKNQ